MDIKTSLQQRPYELDDSVRSRAAIGLVVLATDHVIEHEFRKILNLTGVGLYQSRILNEPSINAETLSAMESRLEDSVRVILPGMPLDVIAYGCTSASMVIGPPRVEALSQNARATVVRVAWLYHTILCTLSAAAVPHETSNNSSIASVSQPGCFSRTRPFTQA